MNFECSSQRITQEVILGLRELNCDWLKIPSHKSFPGSGSQTLFLAETSDSHKYVCVRRLSLLLLFVATTAESFLSGCRNTNEN